MTIIPESVPQVKNIFDAPPTCSSYELLSLWRRAADTGNARLANAVRAAAAIHPPGLHPATLALLLDAHAAAAQGVSYAAWTAETGGPYPAETFIVQAEAFPHQWYQPGDVEQPDIDRDDELLGLDDVAAKFGKSTRAVQRMVSNGQLPPPIKVGNRSLWPAAQITEHLARRARAASDRAEAERRRAERRLEVHP